MSDGSGAAVGAFVVVGGIGLMADFLAVAALSAVVAPAVAIVFGIVFYGGLLITLIFAGSSVMAYFTKNKVFYSVADALLPIAGAFAAFIGVALCCFAVAMGGILLFWGGLVLLGHML